MHPALLARIDKILPALALWGHPMLILEGVRTAERQAILYAQGRTAPGAIVTQCDGLKTKSHHQVHADGFGHAVDCVFLVDGQPSWNPALPWAVYGAMVIAEGLIWGGSWHHGLIDLPHAEWPDATGVPV
ncbi:MAG: M15 family peptidase [Aquabacterium sp.]|uniref:M15 family metallopeptidase n=1 Tax=Aquabacterium sp. TaxID=1872578 RepID=UPI001202FEF2|nr:M15 family metallopeptidase [Aquabacterium sp.]TAK81830.1 MAG: M15 family peptidase [Aquabacterium sp.]